MENKEKRAAEPYQAPDMEVIELTESVVITSLPEETTDPNQGTWIP